METIIDTSTLISLARISFLELIPRLGEKVVLPKEVYKEAVIRGEEKEVADAIVIKRFINNYNIKIVDVEIKYLKILRQNLNKALAKGDEEVLALALGEKAKGVITNDDGLGKIAMALGFNVKATPDLLMKGLRKNILDLQEFEAMVRELVIENRLTSKVAELYIMEVKKYAKR